MKEILSDSEFETTVGRGVSLVDFNAPWCAPCRLQDPILVKLAEQYEGRAIFAKMNVDKNGDTAMKLGIQSIPTMIIFKDGKEIARLIGVQPEDILKNSIDGILD